MSRASSVSYLFIAQAIGPMQIIPDPEIPLPKSFSEKIALLFDTSTPHSTHHLPSDVNRRESNCPNQK